MKNIAITLSLLVCCLAISKVSYGKRYTIPVHSVTKTVTDSDSTGVALQLINHDSTGVLQVKWKLITDNFAFSGWTYSFCDVAQCYVTSYPQSATDNLTASTNGAFTIEILHFNNIATNAVMSLQVWDPTDPTNIDTVTMTVNVARLGIKAPEISPISIEMYPNPATDYLHLSLNNPGFVPVNALIRDIAGKTVSEQAIVSGGNQVPVYGLPSGLYFITLRDRDGRQSTQKFVKD